jgi:hypothetical protein
MRIGPALVFAAVTAMAAPAFAQQCLHGPEETPAQKTRRQQALGAARAVNSMQFNRPGARDRKFLDHTALAALAARNPAGKPDFTPGADVVAGWQLTLTPTADGYWFLIKDTTDPCSFAYISNQEGIIYSAAPIR